METTKGIEKLVYSDFDFDQIGFQNLIFRFSKQIIILSI
jgi:hypothetical protein